MTSSCRGPRVREATRWRSRGRGWSNLRPDGLALRGLHGTRKSNAVTAWLERLRLAPAEAGSCVLKVLSEVPPALEPQGSLILSHEPFARQATALLLLAVDGARDAAARAAGAGDVRRFEAAIGRE